MFKRNAFQNGKWLAGEEQQNWAEVAKENSDVPAFRNFILAEYIHIVPLLKRLENPMKR